MPGIYIPDAIMERIATAGDAATRVGVEIAQELLDRMAGMTQGAYIIPSRGHYEQAAELVAYLKEREENAEAH